MVRNFFIRLKNKVSSIPRWFVIVLILFATGVQVFIYVTNRTGSINPHPSSARIQKELGNEKTAQFLTDIAPREVTFTADEKKLQPPKFDIKKYLTLAALPQLKKDISIYEFKTNFTETEVKVLAQKLLGSTVQKNTSSNNNTVNFGNNQGELEFNLSTGGFSLKTVASKLPTSLPANNSEKMVYVNRYLADTLGVIDKTVKPTAYYIKNNDSNVLYIEFHRTDVDLPIYNPFALVTIPDSQKIDSLSFTKFKTDDPDDESITYASDKPGKARKTDFNSLTVTLAVVPESNEAYILSIESNIRPIVKSSTLSSRNLSLLDPNSIISELKNGAYFNMTLPSGVGKVDLNKVYPNNRLVTKNATITDISLGYFEKPSIAAQQYLQPGYLVRGYTDTETGIRVNISQVVPAVNDPAIYADHQPGILQKVLAYITKKIIPDGQAQVNVLDNSSNTCKEGDKMYFCNTETFKKIPTPLPSGFPTAIPSVIPTQLVPTAVNPPTGGPTSGPTVSPTPGPSTPCVLYDKTGKVIEYAYEFTTPELTMSSESTSGKFTQKLTPIKVAYFRSLPNGPLFFRTDDGSAQPPTDISSTIGDLPIGSGNQPRANYSTTSDTQINYNLAVELNIRAAQVLMAKPELVSTALIPYYPNCVGDDCLMANVNSIFPEVPINMNNHAWSILGTFRGFFRMAVLGSHGWTIESLAQQPQPLKDIPTRVIMYSRLSFGGTPTQINQQGNLNKYLFDQRCSILSPISPSWYFYTEKPTNVQFAFGHSNVSYADPYVPQEGAQFTVFSNGTFVSDTGIRNRLYYEYVNTALSKPKNGWVIPSEQVNSFIDTVLSPRLKLTDSETHDLLLDIKASLIGKKQKTFTFVGLASETEVNEKLPVRILPLPQNIRRIHLYLEAIDGSQSIEQPPINPIIRSNFSAVELGVYVK